MDRSYVYGGDVVTRGYIDKSPITITNVTSRSHYDAFTFTTSFQIQSILEIESPLPANASTHGLFFPLPVYSFLLVYALSLFLLTASFSRISFALIMADYKLSAQLLGHEADVCSHYPPLPTPPMAVLT